ncbi:MAG: DNA methylase [Vulcanimicrobiaceae bacterium]
MAESPAHRLGQIIGEVLEAALAPRLRAFAEEHLLFLDMKGPRPARHPNKKLSWRDSLGNVHDLDFVLERGGSPDKVGTPVAFIECAWRRYTKHSRNKAQEIQGAVSALANTYSHVAPFLGVVLAGEFTGGALKQLRSLGFEVLFFPRSDVVSAFAQAGIDIGYGEGTPDDYVASEVGKWDVLPVQSRQMVVNALVTEGSAEVVHFFDTLRRVILRKIKDIIVLPLHGREAVLHTIAEAIDYVEHKGDGEATLPFLRFEIVIRYETGDTISASFGNTGDALDFLRSFEPLELELSQVSAEETEDFDDRD